MKANDHVWLIDLDGTMYKGNKNIDGAREFIAFLQKQKAKYVFVTNNATRSRLQNLQHMQKLGFVNLKEEDFFTSAMASARYIARHYDERRAAFLGEAGLEEALLASNFQICEEKVDFFFVGLEKQADYMRYSWALQKILNGAQLIGTNGDRKLPHDETYLIGNGAVLQMLAYASGQTPLIIGKPSSYMMEEVLSYVQADKTDCVLLGDNLETDIAFGLNNDVPSIFVSSGVHTLEDMHTLQMHPGDHVHDLYELIEKLTY